ncbi:hypothetical protein [Pseudomonas sp. GWSMS-1]|uniref:hypothetical protein n=1 Tax=Pseudomonas sp. GWSMS-1 TaxID=3308997 RepID=UPI003CF790C0
MQALIVGPRRRLHRSHRLKSTKQYDAVKSALKQAVLPDTIYCSAQNIIPIINPHPCR